MGMVRKRNLFLEQHCGYFIRQHTRFDNVPFVCKFVAHRLRDQTEEGTVLIRALLQSIA